MDPVLLRAMRDYVGDVREFLEREVTARFITAFYQQNSKAKRPIIFGAVGFAYIVIPVVAVLSGSGRTFPMSLAGVIALLWVSSIAAFAYGWAVMFAVPSPTALAAQQVVQCANCGSMRTVTAGSPVDRCRSCDGTILVPTDVAGELLARSAGASAEALRRQAATLHDGDYGQSMVTRVVVGVVVAVPAGLGLGAFLLVAGGPTAPEWLLRVVLWLPALIALPWLVAAPIRARSSRRRITAIVDRLLA